MFLPDPAGANGDMLACHPGGSYPKNYFDAGHSMGGSCLSVQQAEHRTYAAVAVLGFSCAQADGYVGDGSPLSPEEGRRRAAQALRDGAVNSPDSAYHLADRGRGFFHLTDAPGR